ncbi:hypothetical protein [Rhodococcus yananensis]|nr:hypothetical protein [Rhodococcus yananensis]
MLAGSNTTLYANTGSPWSRRINAISSWSRSARFEGGRVLKTCITNHFRLREQNVPAEYPIVHRQLAADPETPKNVRAGRRKKKPSG